MSIEPIEDVCLEAFLEGNKEVGIEMLLKMYFPAVVRGAKNKTLLHLSALNGWCDITELLATKFQCDPFSVDDEGFSVLHYACMSGNLDVVKYLVQNLALDPENANNRRKKTPIELSERGGHYAVVQYLKRVIG